MKRILALIFASILALTPLAACTTEVGNDPTQAPTAEPEAIVTDTPEPIVTDTPEAIVTDTPEPEPSASSVVYDEYELAELLKFMESVGVISDRTNGALICPDYDADDPTTWVVEGRPLVGWTEDGHVECFSLVFGDSLTFGDYLYGRTLMYLGGSLALNGFDELTWLSSVSVYFDELTIQDCNSLTEVWIFGSEFKKVHFEADIALLRGNVYAGEFYWRCNDVVANCLFELSLSASGDGLVGCNKYGDEDRDFVFINARANAGSTFVGWYDEEGNLVSTERVLEISSDEMNGCVGTFNYTARFEKD
ncbi:MAG: hypothetical protein MR899_02720 [Clostridium sp.]|nr:hypothetical protein [Clostridium sp.]